MLCARAKKPTTAVVCDVRYPTDGAFVVWVLRSGCFCGILRSRKKDKASRSRVAAAAQAARANPRVTDQSLTVSNSLPDRLMADVLMHSGSGVSETSGAHSEPQLTPSVELPPDDGGVSRNHTETSTTTRGSDEVPRSSREANSPLSPTSPSLMRRLSSAAKRLGSGGSQKRISLDGPLPAAPGVSIVGNARRPPGAVCARYDIHHTATESECAPATHTQIQISYSFELTVVSLIANVAVGLTGAGRAMQSATHGAAASQHTRSTCEAVRT